MRIIYAVLLCATVIFTTQAEAKSFDTKYLEKSIVTATGISNDEWTSKKDKILMLSTLLTAKACASELGKMEDPKEINTTINIAVQCILIAIKSVDGVEFTEKGADDTITAPDQALILYKQLNQAALDLIRQKIT